MIVSVILFLYPSILFLLFLLFLLPTIISTQVVANLKKANLVGVASTGMVLCAVDKETGATEIVEPPANAEIGERVFVDGYEGIAYSESQEKKKKGWRKLQPTLSTNDSKICVWEDKPLMTKNGPCTVASLTGAMLK